MKKTVFKVFILIVVSALLMVSCSVFSLGDDLHEITVIQGGNRVTLKFDSDLTWGQVMDRGVEFTFAGGKYRFTRQPYEQDKVKAKRLSDNHWYSVDSCDSSGGNLGTLSVDGHIFDCEYIYLGDF